MSNQTKTILVDAKQYEDADDCLQAATLGYLFANKSVEPWQVEAKWTDNQRDTITLTIG